MFAIHLQMSIWNIKEEIDGCDVMISKACAFLMKAQRVFSESHHKLHPSLTHPSISTNGVAEWVVFYVDEVYGITATE